MMTSFKTPAVWSVTLASLLGASSAVADVTAEQVWADWQTYMTSVGYTISATEARSGDDLQVTDIVMSTEIPDEDVSINLTLSEITFTDNGDGTVSIVLPPSMPMGLMVDAPDEDPVTFKTTYSTKDWSAVVSGAPNDISYSYSAAEIGITIDEVTVDQVTLPMSTVGTVEMTMADVAGSTQSRSGGLYELVQKVTSGPVSYLVDVTDPDGAEGRLVMKGGAGSIDMAVLAALPPDADMTDIASTLAQGFTMDASLNVTGGSIDMNFNDTGEIFQLKTSSDSNEFSVGMNSDGLGYSLASTAQKIFMAGTEIPLPIEISAEEYGFSLQMPVTARDDIQPVAMSFTLGDLVVSDLIWGLIDPTGQLPRDPATLSVALTGTVKLLVDMLDPATMAQLDAGSAQPGELHSLDVTGLTVRAAGAELLGNGSFTFDNTDLATFDGIPAPSGKLNLSLSGGNGLLDKLVAMGLFPAEEASGVRMMMGLFAVPGSGPDSLTSTIEVQPNGQVFANGQRIQ